MSRYSVFITRRLPEPALTRLLDAVDAEVWPDELRLRGIALLGGGVPDSLSEELPLAEPPSAEPSSV